MVLVEMSEQLWDILSFIFIFAYISKKGQFSQKIKILPSFTRPHAVTNLLILFFLQKNTKSETLKEYPGHLKCHKIQVNRERCAQAPKS